MWHPAEHGERVAIPGLGDAIPIRSARAAVVIALKALGMSEGSRIGVPLFCCPVVFKAIRAAGCTPRFIDIDPDTYCLSPEDLLLKRPSIDALIAVHMFGNVCDMPKILEIVKGLPVIEDCAQSLGSKVGDLPSGSFGDIAFFSFRSGKYLAVGEGGALFSPQKALQDRLADLVRTLPVPGRGEEFKHVLRTYVRSKLRSRPWWGWMGSRIWAIYNKRTEFLDKSPLILSRIFASDLAAVSRRMPRLGSMIAARRANAEYLDKSLVQNTGTTGLREQENFSNRFMYPLQFRSTVHRDQVARSLRSRGVGTSTPYEDVISGTTEHYGYQGDCPTAERLLKRTLVIPSYQTLTKRDIEHISCSVNLSMQELAYGGSGREARKGAS